MNDTNNKYFKVNNVFHLPVTRTYCCAETRLLSLGDVTPVLEIWPNFEPIITLSFKKGSEKRKDSKQLTNQRTTGTFYLSWGTRSHWLVYLCRVKVLLSLGSNLCRLEVFFFRNLFAPGKIAADERNKTMVKAPM